MRRVMHMGNAAFVGSFVAHFTYPSAPLIGSVYSPVQGLVYTPFATGIYIVDPTGNTPGVIATVSSGFTMANCCLAYLPVSDTILVVKQGGSHKIFDCATATFGSLVNWSGSAWGSPTQMTGPYAANPANDLVYILSKWQVGRVDAAGNCVKSGFGSPAWTFSNVDAVGIAFNPADGYVYATGTGGSHTYVSDPGSAFALVIDHAVASNESMWRNPTTGKIWSGDSASAFNLMDASAVVSRAATTSAKGGDYDPITGVLSIDRTATHPTVRQYSTADVFGVNAAANASLSAGGERLVAAYNQGRYVVHNNSGTAGDVYSRY